MSKLRLYVGNLHYNATEDDLRNHFSEHFTVADVKIITDRDTGKSRGFAFVEIEGNTDQAVAILDGSELLGRTLKISPALEREKRGGGGGGYARGRDSGRRERR